MNSRQVDLFLGGPLGLWALDNVDRRQVGRVFSADDKIFTRARDLGIPFAVAEAIMHANKDELASVGLSFHFPTLLKPPVLARYERLYNIHPALLPWGRCYYPVFWALWADEPAGCTLHEIDAGIDSGPIVAQIGVQKYDWDTGGSLHQRVSDAEKALFLQYWPLIAGGMTLPAAPQAPGGSFHYKREFFELKQPESLDKLTALDLLRLSRCLAHPAYTGMLVTLGGRHYELRLEAR